jgi:uncharacterized protein YjdB
MKTAGGGAIPRLARVMTCLMLMLTGLTTGAWAADTYTVAGSNSNMFGSAWDATYTANDMTKNSDGTYSITYTNVYLDGDVQYKVVKNHSWDEAYPDGNNRVITIAEAGTYTVTICFNPTTHEVYEKKPGYTVSLAEGTEDAENWTITPVEGLNEGEAVTIQYNGTRRIKSVTAVLVPVLVSGITLSKTTAEIKAGETTTLNVTAVTPEKATDKTYTWSSSNEAAATVDQNGVVTAKTVTADTAVNITATANDGSGVKATCVVTVKPLKVNNNGFTIGGWDNQPGDNLGTE